jgi:divalent metal cation (Fe/Co/Zn/Cd) transporter
MKPIDRRDVFAALGSPSAVDEIMAVYRESMSELVHIQPIGPQLAQPCPVSAPANRQVVWLQIVTLAWMLVECLGSIYAATRAHSVALFAFGSDSFVELLSAGAVLMQFTPGWKLSRYAAARVAGWLLFILAGVVAALALTSLRIGAQPDRSPLGIALTVAALILMPCLAALKRRKAIETNDRALAADAAQSATCAYLAAITLLGLIVTAIFGVRGIDSIAALCAVPLLIVEGIRTLRGQSCGCCG